MKRNVLVLSLAALGMLGLAVSVHSQRTPDQAKRDGIKTNRPVAYKPPLPSRARSWKFVIFGDRTGGETSGLKVLKQAVKDTNLLAPDLVMTVGDLVQGYNTQKPWMRQMLTFKAIMNKLEMRWFPVAGNHDIYWYGKGRPPGHHEANYEKHFGPLWYWFPHKNVAFIVLYTDEGDPLTGHKGHHKREDIQMSKQQLSWLKHTLQSTRHFKHAFVFLHHPRWTNMYYKENNWPTVHKLLAKAGNVRAVFAGHIHHLLYSGKQDGIEYHALGTTGGSLFANVPQLGMLHHMNIVTVRPDRFAMASLPIGTLRDPKIYTAKRIKVAQALLSRITAKATHNQRLAFSMGKAVKGTYETTFANTSKYGVWADLLIEARKTPWHISPRHVRFWLDAGASKTLKFRYNTHTSKPQRRFPPPTMQVSMELRQPKLQLRIPRRSFPMELQPPKQSPASRPATAPSAVQPKSKVTKRPSSRPSAKNKALRLDGNTGCLAIQAHHIRYPKESFTVEGFFKRTRQHGVSALISQSDNGGFGLFVREGTLVGAMHSSKGYVRVESPKKVPYQKWFHAALVYDGSELRLYVNGEHQGASPAPGTWKRGKRPLYIGADPNWTLRPSALFHGEVDELRISSIARYKGPKVRIVSRHSPDKETLVLLHFDKVFGPVVLDHSQKPVQVLRQGRTWLFSVKHP